MKTKYTKHELAMIALVRDEIDNYVGGYENQMLDFSEDSEEYKKAYNYLYKTPATNLLEKFYEMVMKRCKSGSNAEHARFAGGDFLRARLGAYIVKNKLGKEFHNA